MFTVAEIFEPLVEGVKVLRELKLHTKVKLLSKDRFLLIGTSAKVDHQSFDITFEFPFVNMSHEVDKVVRELRSRKCSHLLIVFESQERNLSFLDKQLLDLSSNDSTN